MDSHKDAGFLLGGPRLRQGKQCWQQLEQFVVPVMGGTAARVAIPRRGGRFPFGTGCLVHVGRLRLGELSEGASASRFSSIPSRFRLWSPTKSKNSLRPGLS